MPGDVFKWVLSRSPILLALAAVIWVGLVVQITKDPQVPVIDSWIEPADQRVVAKLLLCVLVFVLVALLASMLLRYVMSATPARMKGPLGFELDWTLEDATALKENDDKLQRQLEEQADFGEKLARRVNRLAAKLEGEG